MYFALPLFIGTEGLWLAQATTEVIAALIATLFLVKYKKNGGLEQALSGTVL
jgi:Na+-driven multidrug efflux pump